MRLEILGRSFGMIALLLWIDGNDSNANPPLAYRPATNQEFQYEYDIELNLGNEQVQLSGTTVYQVEESTETQVRFRFTGGLKETRKSNDSRQLFRIPSLPRMGARFGSFSRGTTDTTNSLTLSSTGEMIALKGESQLPYLLGNLSLLPFETLPAVKAERWQANGTTGVLSEKSSNHWPPFGPGFDSNDRDLRAAETKLRYRILRQDEKEAVIEKKIELVLSPTQEKGKLKVTGQGEWTFSKTQRMPASMDFKYELKIEKKGVMVSIPLTLKYRLLTKDEIKAKQKAKAEREMQAKRLAEEKKAKAAQPVTDEEKSKWLDVLRSDNDYEQVRTLQELAGRTPPNRHEDMIKAIGELLEDENQAVAMTAKSALRQWDAKYKRASELESKYSGSMPLKDTGIEVHSETPLYVGQVIQVKQSNGWWKAAEITELLPSGRAEVQMRDHWKERKMVDRSEMQLPPAEYIQPIAPPSDQSAALTNARTWKDASGLFTLKATLHSIANDSVVLVGEDGKQMTIPLDKLSEADQLLLNSLPSDQTKGKNPFQPVP